MSTPNPFAATLKTLRKQRGFASARAFYLFMTEKQDLEINYTYYARIESGTVLPSATTVERIASRFHQQEAETLTLAWCRTQFPEKAYLFSGAGKMYDTTPAPHDMATHTRVRELTAAQITQIAKSRMHYRCFYLFTLARRPIKQEEAETLFGSAIQRVLKDFEHVRLITIDQSGITSLANDLKFPKPDSETLLALYDKIRKWNQTLDDDFELNALCERVLFRRVSKRYVHLLHDHCELLLDLLRTGDEINIQHNNDVVLLRLHLSNGEIPG
jgi:transcriptional regulator with XRE-family HTH domain